MLVTSSLEIEFGWSQKIAMLMSGSKYLRNIPILFNSIFLNFTKLKVVNKLRNKPRIMKKNHLKSMLLLKNQQSHKWKSSLSLLDSLVTVAKWLVHLCLKMSSTLWLVVLTELSNYGVWGWTLYSSPTNFTSKLFGMFTSTPQVYTFSVEVRTVWCFSGKLTSRSLKEYLTIPVIYTKSNLPRIQIWPYVQAKTGSLAFTAS